MPQYLEQRFDSKVKTVLALFWLAVYVFVNLTAVLWLGGLAIETVAGVDWMYGMIFLALFSVAYSLYGGLKAVAYTDILQVVLLFRMQLWDGDISSLRHFSSLYFVFISLKC